MAVKSMRPEYVGEVRDRVENFHGNQLVYVGWDHHLMFCSAFTFMVSPQSTFRMLRDETIVQAFSQHPEWSAIDWNAATWLLDGACFEPDLDKTLIEQGIGHKSLLRFQTPELKGYKAAGV